MEATKTDHSVDSAEHPADSPTPINPDHQREGKAWLAAPAIAILAVVCCAGPLLLGVLGVSGAGAWLAAHGYGLAAGTLLALGALLGWRGWARARPRDR